MMLLLHLIPVWAWVAILFIALAAGLAAYLGVLAPVVAVVRGFFVNIVTPFVKAHPRGCAEALLTVVCFVGVHVWMERHDAEIAGAAAASRDAYWRTREKAANDAAEQRVADLNRKLEHANENAAANGQKASQAIAENEQLRAAQRAAADKERTENVTAQAVADCHLHRGIIVQFNREAARANGEPVDESAEDAAARRATADQASGITLDTYSAAVDDTQRALGRARDQVAGWNHYFDDVLTPWYAEVSAALSNCVPKGDP